MPRQDFIDKLHDIARDLEFDAAKAYRTFARLNADITPKMLPEWQKVGAWLGMLAPEAASQKIQAQIKRITKEDEEKEALDEMERGARRSLLIKVAIETGNPRLAALVFSVTRGTYPKFLRRGKRFTAAWLGQQVGIGKRQAQKLIRQAITHGYLGGRRIRSGWVLWASDGARDQFIRRNTDHYDVALARKLKSISAAIVLDMMDPEPQEEDYHVPPQWKFRFSAKRVAGQLPWLSHEGARLVLEKLVGRYLKKVKSSSRKGDEVYEYQLAKSRWSNDENK